jgi:ribonuclease PH
MTKKTTKVKSSRPSGRADDELRPVKLETGFLDNPLGSVLISVGATKVLCTATVDDRVPPFLKSKEEGWVTGEYAMIPGATNTRSMREVSRGRASGRTHEIQRLIGRAMRSIVDRKALGERTVWIDCEVLQADGGTRAAGITGGFVALTLALYRLKKAGAITGKPLFGQVAAVSVGLVSGRPLLDLEYAEDSIAEVDMNVACTDSGKFVEVQGTAESAPFSRAELDALLRRAEVGIERLLDLQREALGPALTALLHR